MNYGITGTNEHMRPSSGDTWQHSQPGTMRSTGYHFTTQRTDVNLDDPAHTAQEGRREARRIPMPSSKVVSFHTITTQPGLPCPGHIRVLLAFSRALGREAYSLKRLFCRIFPAFTICQFKQLMHSYHMWRNYNHPMIQSNRTLL